MQPAEPASGQHNRLIIMGVENWENMRAETMRRRKPKYVK